jgi:hypothetical protein
MENKWLIYQKTLKNIYNNQKIFMNMMIYYYKLIIINKENNDNYIHKNHDFDLELFNEYIVKTKNLGIFTIFNNIPDIIHPLETEYYTDFGMYLSFIKPNFFKKSENDDILIFDHNIWKMNNYEKPFQFQFPGPYNKYKKYIYLNIKHFDLEKYKDYLIIVVNDNKEIYSYDNNIIKIIKKKEKNTWKIVDDIINTKFIYACILRKISQEDILNTFNGAKSYRKIHNLNSLHYYCLILLTLVFQLLYSNH